MVNRFVRQQQLIFHLLQDISIISQVIETEEGTVNDIDKDTMSIVRHEPIGVVGAVVAWNFPMLLAAWKIAPAIAAGNTPL